jgi:hypothetical protein
MTNKTYSMPGEDHIQQFPHAREYLDNEDHARPMWWELPSVGHEQHFAEGGSVISRLRAKKATARHPALNIPGVHIRTAEAGEPIFHGEK